MKNILLVILLGLASPLLWAQTEEEIISTRVIYLDTVYEHSLGFVVKYGEQYQYYNEVALPLKWFGSTHSAVGRLHYIKGGAVPFLVLYFRNGNVSNINLYISENPFHLSRATLKSRKETRELFNVTLEDTVF